jgi:DNA-binding NarL/FixJ family response regulator
VPSVRVLVVEDHESFRRLICSTLEQRPELQVVGRVSDGLEAVHKAEELQPDLILLDIGLPTLNGIEAAGRIRKLSPQSKILFVSQESSADMVKAALVTGARGYVVKMDVGRELLTAVDTVVRGEKFVGSRFASQDFTRAGDGDPSTSNFAPLQQKVEITRNHEVQFYSNEGHFLAGLAIFIEDALKAGAAVIVVATESHRKSLHQRLQGRGVSTIAAIGQGRYVPLDAAESLSAFMDSTGPNRDRFLSTFGPLICSAKIAAGVQNNSVLVFGEMVAMLWAGGRMEAAIELERLWNELAQTHLFHLRCAYPMSQGLRGEPYASICAEHSVILPVEM